MRGVSEDAGGEEVGGHGVSPQGGDLGPQDGQDLAHEALHEAGETAHLDEINRAGHFRYFLIFSIIKKRFFAFFIKLILLGVAF